MAAPQSRQPSRFESWLSPRALFVGVVVAFLGCCLLGRGLSRVNPYTNFHRFHQAITPASLYFPTASQVLSLARERLPADRIAVIIGGNSVFRGHCQTENELWSDRLQEKLGDRYRVLNLALDGGRPWEVGGLTATMLAQNHPRVILVTGARSNGRKDVRSDGDVYRYFFWDAYHKGLLPSHPQRHQKIAEMQSADAEVFATQDAQIRATADGWVYANDLWTWVAHQVVNTVWTPNVDARYWKPRRLYPDAGKESRPLAVRFTGRSEAHGRNSVAQTARGSDGHSLVEACKTAFTSDEYNRTCVIVSRECPHYMKQLPDHLRTRYEKCVGQTLHGLRDVGFTALDPTREFSENDYADHCHLSPDGGEKLAERVAEEVRKMASRLGYLNEEMSR